METLGGFEKLIHQDNAYRELAHFWTSRHFTHALLIEGAEGSGKKTLARFAAARILCTDEDGIRPCGMCPACKKMLAGGHPDLIVSDGSEEKPYPMDYIRSLRSSAFRAPNESEHKIYMLTEMQNMPAGSQNALLKLIEEPPEHVCFIMTATSRSALLPTILSRVTLLQLEELSYEERKDIIKKLCPDADAKKRNEAAKMFETVGQALSALSDEKTQSLLETVSALCEAVISRDRYRTICLLSVYDDKDKRDEYIKMLSLLRVQFIRQLENENPPFSALQCTRIVDIIEKTQVRSAVNVGRQLLSTVLANGLIAALSPTLI